MALALEVISGSERVSGIAAKTEWYAVAGVAVLVAADPRDGTWTLSTHPRDGKYQGMLRGKYGEPIPLAPPLPATLQTAALPIDAPRR